MLTLLVILILYSWFHLPPTSRRVYISPSRSSRHIRACTIVQARTLPIRLVIKIKSNGRFKARLVAKGFKQKHGKDFRKVYAAVAKPTGFKILIALAARFGWQLHHIDIATAFLNAKLKEIISYMSIHRLQCYAKLCNCRHHSCTKQRQNDGKHTADGCLGQK